MNEHLRGHCTRRLTDLAALRVVLAATSVLALAGCGDKEQSTQPDVFDVAAKLSGNTYFGVKQDGKCTFVDGVYAPNMQIVLRGADNQILSTSTLAVADDSFPAEGLALCSLSFNLKGIRSGETAYQLSVGSVGPIVVTEHQLRDKDFKLTPRNEMMPTNGEPIIKVYPPA